MMRHEDLRFMPQSTIVTVSSEPYRPPCFPPPDDWVVTLDIEGKPLSRYGHNYWDYSAFGHPGFNFGKHNLSCDNLKLVKQALLFCLYSRLFPGNIMSCSAHFNTLIKIAKVCDKQGILISQLSSFPQVHPSIASALQDSNYSHRISILHRLNLFKGVMGFVIADKKTLAYLASEESEHEPIQNAYIPPRIWNYQVNRLKECIDDFLNHKPAIETIFTEIARAYEQNSILPTVGTHSRISPFRKHKGYKKQIIFAESFESLLEEHGLLELFSKWLGDISHIISLTKYLNLVREASLYYIMNFSLQRRGEVSSLRSDCFQPEKDPKLGDIGLIIGETTKTDPDSDARWVVPMAVSEAVDAASVIAQWRMKYRPKDLADDIVNNPYLLTPAWEPWNASRVKNKDSVRIKFARDYGVFSDLFPYFFDLNEITISQTDWKIALSLTPNLSEHRHFSEGKPWPFGMHQLRRTTCINMFSSSLVSETSLQWSMKHLNRNMTLYYGRNYSNLRLNAETERAVIQEHYRAIYRQLCEVVNDAFAYVRPHKKETIPASIIRLIDSGEEKKLTALIKKGVTGCRQTLLGYCMKNGTCEYGGIESVAKCAGKNGKDICADAIFSRKNETKLGHLKEMHERSIENADKHSPKTSAAMQEIYAIETYLNVINRK